MLEELLAEARMMHQERFGVMSSWAASAPGRVNLIGDHTDYTDGFAMPFAINRYTVVVASPRAATAEPEHRVFSSFAKEEVALQEGPPRALDAGAQWHDYLVGVITLMAASGYQVPRLDLTIHSNLPVGSGLSSSASLELAIASLLEAVCTTPMDPTQKMLLCQRVEHEYALVPCGLMDQFTVCAGQRDKVLALDCRSQTAELVALQGDRVQFLIVDSQVRHQHSGGGYAERRAECTAAQEALGISLRDATLEHLAELADAKVQQRARHVVTENARVLAVAAAMDAGDYPGVGQAMNASHASLRDDFAVSCPEVDTLVSIAQGLPGVYGARMTGGGFGGSVVLMVQPAEVEPIARQLAQRYREATGLATEPLPVVAVDGARAHDDNL